MTLTEVRPETSGGAPAPGRLKHAGTDDRCSWIVWGLEAVQLGYTGRCPDPATDTVKGKTYCSPHADKAAGI